MSYIYVKPTEEFNLSKNQLLKLLKPLYGLSDSGGNWHAMFSKHLIRVLSMAPTSGDLPFFLKTGEGKLKGMTGAYVDDTIGTVHIAFEKESLLTGERFQSRERERSVASSLPGLRLKSSRMVTPCTSNDTL